MRQIFGKNSQRIFSPSSGRPQKQCGEHEQCAASVHSVEEAPGTIQARNTGIENAASNSFRVYAIRVQLRPKWVVLAVNFGEESQ